MSGVIHLWKSGSYGIAAIVFIASIMVPLFKLLALSVLLLSVQRRTTWWPMQRARLYRLVELVGRWSMLDIYVVTLLAALVQHVQIMAEPPSRAQSPNGIPCGAKLVGALRHQYGRIRSQLVRPGYLRPDPRTIYPDAATDDARWGGGSSPDSPETG